MGLVDSRERKSRELYVEIGQDDIIRNISFNSQEVLGYENQFMIGKRINEFTNETLDINRIDLSDQNNRICIPFKKLSGEIIYMDIEFVDNKYSDNYKTISMVDVTKYVLQEEKLKRVLQIFEKSEDIIYSLDLKPKPSYVYLSPGIEKSLGYSLDNNVNPFNALEVIHPDYSYIQKRKLRGELGCNQSIVTRYKHYISGKYIWFEDYCMPIYNEAGDLVRIDGICRNIQDRKELEEKLKYLSYNDALTGLHNRTYLEENIKELDEKRDVKVGIIICDLDNLKHINDKLGHFEGDQLIKATGEIIKHSFKNKFVAARYGGDEFVIVLEDLRLEQMEAEVFKFKNRICQYNESTHLKLPIHISIGFSYSDNSRGNIREVFKRADKNMFNEKTKTKGGIVLKR